MRIAVVLLVGCSPTPKPVVDVPPAAPTTTTSPTSTSTGAKAGCPPSGKTVPACTAKDDPGRCEYADTTCYCGQPPYCGGAAPPPPPPPRWICEPKKAPCPAAGTACTGTGSCSSGPCGWEGFVACQNGKWTPQMISPPP